MQNKDSAIDRDTLLRNVWGDGYIGDRKIVDVNIRRLRAKIEESANNPRFLITMWGYGYKFRDV
jgi:DNA-binding response OmpR family regulator